MEQSDFASAATARLLERAGKAVLVVDGGGAVRWANAHARAELPSLAAPGTRLDGFIPGQPLIVSGGRLECEAVDDGWALFLETDGPVFSASQMLDLLPVPIFWKDRAGIYRGCNRAFAEMMNCAPDAMIGKGVYDVCPPDLAAKYHAMDEELMTAGPDAVQRYEWNLASKSGTLRTVQFHKANLLDGDGKVAGLIGMCLDISELRRLERQFSTVFKACPDPITITERATGRYVEVNDAFFSATGWTREEALGRTSLELGIWVDAEDRKALLAVLEPHGRLSNFETRFRRKDGSIFTALVSVETTMLDGVECMILNARDITDRKHEEVLLRQTAEELHRSNADLERFAYVAAHDLQEPCRTICSFAQLLERRCGDQLGGEGREYLAFVSTGAQRMRDLIHGLLRYSRVDRNTLRLDPVDLGLVLQSALADLGDAVAKTGATVSSGELPMVRGDAVQLRQVFVNLIGNALKFQPQGQHPEVSVSASVADGQCEVVIRDNGIGIDPQYADEVFGMFRRLHGGNAYPGTGIGLALVKRIVEAHGGRIWFDSAPGQGCAFHIALPV